MTIAPFWFSNEHLSLNSSRQTTEMGWYYIRPRSVSQQGRIQDFFNRGGAKRLLRTSRSRSVPTTAVQCPGIFRVLDALSCSVSLILKHCDTKRDKNIVDQNLEGACACCAPLDPPLQGGIQDFQIEGAQKIMDAAHIPWHEARNPLRPTRSRAPFEGPGRFRVLDPFHCYLSLILKQSDTKLKKHNRSKYLEGTRRGSCAPLWIRHFSWLSTASVRFSHPIVILFGL